jgi:hypothetical protein
MGDNAAPTRFSLARRLDERPFLLVSSLSFANAAVSIDLSPPDYRRRPVRSYCGVHLSTQRVQTR